MNKTKEIKKLKKYNRRLNTDLDSLIVRHAELIIAHSMAQQAAADIIHGVDLLMDKLRDSEGKLSGSCTLTLKDFQECFKGSALELTTPEELPTAKPEVKPEVVVVAGDVKAPD